MRDRRCQPSMTRAALPLLFTTSAGVCTALGLCLLGCGGGAANGGGAASTRFEVEVQVESDPGKPLAAAGIFSGSNELGRTGEDGRVRVALTGHNGDVIALRVHCPERFASPSKALSVTLLPLVGQGVVPQYRAQCQPLVRSLAVAVRAKGGANVPLKHMGREIARTDADGAAHALLEVAPAEQVTLVLDTSEPAHERLRPKNPEFTLVMPARDEVAVFDQTFTELAPPPKKAQPVARPLGPTRIAEQQR